MSIQKIQKFKRMKSIIIIISFLIVLSLSIVSAEFWACFSKGQKIDYCNPKVDDRTCGTSGGCIYCMSNFNTTKNCYNQGNWLKCNNLQQGCNPQGNTSIDKEPPKLTINEPDNGDIFDSRSIPVDLKVDEKSDILMYDNIYGRGRWTRICNNCYSHIRKRSFKEGFNNITFKAVDVVGNSAEETVAFYIDSKKPKITKTEPKNGFASGEFEVWFKEENPKKLFLNYGNTATGYRKAELNINDCDEERNTYYCDIKVNLANYDSKIIEYWFNLSDIGNSYAESRHIWLEVDVAEPKINSINWSIYKKTVEFNINITEKNFDEVLYYDNTEPRPRWRTLCSGLKDGICGVKKSFTTGVHILDIQVNDEAGNSIGKSIEFEIL